MRLSWRNIKEVVGSTKEDILLGAGSTDRGRWGDSDHNNHCSVAQIGLLG